MHINSKGEKNMNCMSIVGLVDQVIFNTNKNSIIQLQVDNAYYQGKLNEPETQLINIEVNSEIFKKELNLLKPGLIIAIKGRIENHQNVMKLIAERIKPF